MVANAYLDAKFSHTISACRSCGTAALKPFLNLGLMPLADRLISASEIQECEPRFPLQTALCEACGLVQITETVDPSILFEHHYPYYSSFSPALLKHSRENVLNIIERRNLNGESFVIELASNDGYLLKNYVERGIPVLGIDPADGPAAAARKSGVPTRTEFFTVALAESLKQTVGLADVIHANNVLAHVEDTNGFVKGLRILLKDTGVAVIEVPYVLELIDHREFDTIYHEHLCYFSVSALQHLFRRHDLHLNEIKRLAIHGGSLRLYVEPFERVGKSVTDQLALESKLGLSDAAYYENFSLRIEELKMQVVAILRKLKAEGKTIAAYGAAAKGATLINYFDLGEDIIDFVVDRNVHKHGKYMPGKRIRICDPDALLREMPDVVLMLAWNFADEILEQQKEYRKRGGRFIIPLPEPRIL